MRRFGFVLIVVVAASSAQAGSLFDVPVLRGAFSDAPAPNYQTRWDGAYLGGLFGYTSNNFNFASTTTDLAKSLLQSSALGDGTDITSWDVLGGAARSSMSFGGFVGYNWQWDQAVVGIEANYNFTNASGSVAATPITRGLTPNPADGYYYIATMDGSASARLRDYGTARLRGGYATGNFMPYGTIGVAVGRIDYVRSVTISGTFEPSPQTDPVTAPAPFGPWTKTESKNGAFVYGYAFGVGLDMMLMGNVFARVEWERIQFASPVDISIDAARAGLGFKF